MKNMTKHPVSFWGRFIAVLCLAACVSGPATGEDRQANPQTLTALLAQAAPGDVILLAPGDYDTLVVRRALGTDQNRVTLRSADAQNPARFEALKLNEAEGLTIEGVVFDYTYAPDHNINKLRVSEINRSRHITIRNTVFDGDRATGTNTDADGYGASFGLAIRWAEDVLVEDSVFRTWYRGIVISQAGGITLRGNELYDMRSDGVNFAEVTDVLVERNHFHSFRRASSSRDHTDMIQFWTNGTNPQL